MSNRLMELEDTLAESRRPAGPGQPAGIRRKPPVTARPAPPALALTRPRRASSRPLTDYLRPPKVAGRRQPLARAFTGELDYQVPGLVPVLRQPTPRSCWATVFTMLMSWRRNASLPIETALAEVGERWVNVFRADTGLTSEDKEDFVAEAGLVAQPPMSHTLAGWTHLLRDYGPLWVTTDEHPGEQFAIHARVITAVQGDGTPENTRLTIIDPADGRTYQETFGVFLPKYEKEVRKTGHMRIQVLHWNRDAALAQALTAGVVEAEPEPPASREAIIAHWVAQGVPREEVESFLQELLPEPTAARQLSVALDRPPTEIHLPGGRILEGWRAQVLFQAVLLAISTLPGGNALALAIPLTRQAANRHNLTIGIGPAVTGGLGAGAGLGAGILFAPESRIGFYGSRSVVVGAVASISGSFQVTIIRGGPDRFGGRAIAVGGTLGPDAPAGISGGVHFLLDMDGGAPLGVTFEASVSAGFSPIEFFTQFQWTDVTIAHALATDDIPLSPRIGGKSIDAASLEMGDIILSTTDAAISRGIRLATDSPVSHAALYIGDGQVVEAIREGVVLRQLEEAVAEDTVAVAFRHPDLTEEQRLMVRDFAGQNLDSRYNTWGVVRHAPFIVNRRRCERIPHAGLRQRCLDGMARIFLGTPDNRSFFCSQLLVAAFEHAGASLTTDRPNWVTPADLARMREDEAPQIRFKVQLEYVGHLKA